MTCRHAPGDQSCSSYEARIATARNLVAKADGTTPDSAKFEVENAEQVGVHLVMKVKYPNCAKCSYEGNKVMVFLNTTPLQAMRWKALDPHFRAKKSPNYKEAPSPAARFPASEEGWIDAIAYARTKK